MAWLWVLLVVRWGGCALDADIIVLVDAEVVVVFIMVGAGVAHATVLAGSGGGATLDTDFVQVVGGDGGVVINGILVVVDGCG